MKKKLIIISIFLIMIFACSGCVEVTYGSYIKGNGNVVKEYNVVVDETYDHYGPYTPDYALYVATAQLEGMLERNPEYGEIVVNPDNKYDISLIYTYKNLNEFYRAMGKTGDDLPQEDDSVNNNQLLYMYSTSNVFTDIDEDFAINYCEDMRKAAFSFYTVIPYEDIKINFEYGTPYTKVYTSNATTDYIEDKTKIYRWEMSINEIGNIRTLTSKQPNYGVWYLFAISSSIILSMLMYAIINIKRGKVDGRE